MNTSNSYCMVVGNTDIGCVRKANEDWLANFNSKNGLVAVVCDGMGGHVGGAVASHIAVETIEKYLKNQDLVDPREAIIQACDKANKAILAKGEEQPELKGMGATCVLLIVREGQVFVGSVGDSRIYRIKNHEISQITKDQSFVQMLVDMGEITPEEAEYHPKKNEITNVLGYAQMRPATVLQYDINPAKGEKFLLCSDGLSGMVKNDVILKVADDESLSLEERTSKLIQLAKDNGGRDNITCQILEFTSQPPKLTENKPVEHQDVQPHVTMSTNATMPQTKPLQSRNNNKFKKWMLYLLPMLAAIIVVFALVFVFKACDAKEPAKQPNVQTAEKAPASNEQKKEDNAEDESFENDEFDDEFEDEFSEGDGFDDFGQGDYVDAPGQVDEDDFDDADDLRDEKVDENGNNRKKDNKRKEERKDNANKTNRIPKENLENNFDAIKDALKDPQSHKPRKQKP